jgi:hypothetical protein
MLSNLINLLSRWFFIFQMGIPLPSGKRLHNYGKSPFLIGKPSINGPFSIAMLVYQRVLGESTFFFPRRGCLKEIRVILYFGAFGNRRECSVLWKRSGIMVTSCGMNKPLSLVGKYWLDITKCLYTNWLYVMK